MLILNKKYYINGSLFLLGLIFLLLAFKQVKAVTVKPYQVKMPNSPVVYFLNYASHHKKAYLNADSYLSYDNKWSDIKTISSSELALWPNFELMKTGSSPAVYYIKGSKRAKLNNRNDLESFGFIGEPILNVSEKDLNQYKLLSYQEIGLTSGSSSLNNQKTDETELPNNVINPVSTSTPNNTGTSTPLVTTSGTLFSISSPVQVSDNTLVTNTKDNLIGIFRFEATENIATVTEITFGFGGVFNSALLKNVSVKDENNNIYNANFNLRTNDKKFIITFSDPLVINSGQQKTLKIYLDLDTCDCNNQTIRLELKQASDIKTNLTPALSVATWPLQGTSFKILSANNLLANLLVQGESLANTASNNTGRLLGKYTLGEITGKEDAVVKKLVFSNAGSARKDDLYNFILLSNNQVISRVAEIDVEGNIVFNISYLRVSKGGAITLTVNADLKSNYNKTGTVSLQLKDLSATGLTYNFSLPVKINNINETFTLN